VPERDRFLGSADQIHFGGSYGGLVRLPWSAGGEKPVLAWIRSAKAAW
jgi:hypothetical protein